MILFLTEMWERFSYYGMRSMLIFYLTQHFLFSDTPAYGIYSAYISMIYISPIIGGFVADRWLGFELSHQAEGELGQGVHLEVLCNGCQAAGLVGVSCGRACCAPGRRGPAPLTCRHSAKETSTA